MGKEHADGAKCGIPEQAEGGSPGSERPAAGRSPRPPRWSKPARKRAMLVLFDGAAFPGWSCAAQGEVFGEACFNTSMTGYFEVATDPSYAGQIVAMTYPQIGNYGVCEGDAQSDRPALRGMVVHDMCHEPSNWRSERSFPDYLAANGIVAIEGVDTRALVRHIRDCGAQTAVLSTLDLDVRSLQQKAQAAPALSGCNFVEGVSCTKPYDYTAVDVPADHSFAFAPVPEPCYRVVAYDCGVKRGILENLVRAGCSVRVVPWDTPAEDVLATCPDGVFLSNGPGDPDAVAGTYTQVEKLLGRVPVFGICLGHQMVGKACGAEMEKLKFGHRGANQPVMNLLTRRVETTVQNHGFGIVFQSLGPLSPEESAGVENHFHDLREWVNLGVAPVVRNPRFGRVRLTHVNLDDGTPEGIALLDVPAFSVQYHPEAQAGPTDSHYLFTAFARLMQGRADYLDIDVAADRLAGWRLGAPEGGE